MQNKNLLYTKLLKRKITIYSSEKNLWATPYKLITSTPLLTKHIAALLSVLYLLTLVLKNVTFHTQTRMIAFFGS